MKMRTMIALAASLLLTACAAPAEEAEEAAPAADGEAPVSQEEADTVPEPRNLLPGLDVSGLEASMPEADFAAFQVYLPVLTREETFRWVAGPYDGHPDGDWEPFDADMAAVYDRFWGHDDVEDPPGTLTLDRLAVADIVGDEEMELVLLLQDGDYQFLVFHQEDGEVYGTSFAYRWFESLQETGIYMGSGGADVSYYHQLFLGRTAGGKNRGQLRIERPGGQRGGIRRLVRGQHDQRRHLVQPGWYGDPGKYVG